MKLLIVRHGETEANLKGIWQGQTPGVLTEKGKQQATLLAERLKDEDISLIYTSDLDRAFHTAKIIHEYHKKIPLIKEPELREAYLAAWEGKAERDLDLNNPPKGLETFEELQVRAARFLEKIMLKHKDETVLLVSHTGFIKALVNSVRKIKGYTSDVNQDNACINIIEFTGEKPKIVLLNSTEHLK